MGKTYFSLNTKEGVNNYLEHRKKDVESGLIVKGRHATIKTHLQHFLDFIGKDTKLNEKEDGRAFSLIYFTWSTEPFFICIRKLCLHCLHWQGVDPFETPTLYVAVVPQFGQATVSWEDIFDSPFKILSKTIK